jgi:FkbM family methyltransferase
LVYNKYDSRHVKRIQYELAKDGGTTKMINIDCRTFNDVMQQHNISRIDLLSIDTEGGELGILQTIDFNLFEIDVLVVENNYKDSKLPEFMISRGYNFVIRTGPDEIFKRLVFS